MCANREDKVREDTDTPAVDPHLPPLQDGQVPHQLDTRLDDPPQSRPREEHVEGTAGLHAPHHCQLAHCRDARRWPGTG